ncbi:MAG TPA: methylmalonyl Co-A mutase-associated GTPase MeaB, partial [Thermoanaerobaculia bacterium]|nr:methylmalonyl Co-A mutase-associated GTPase MeaB [Thermoanaerobaculia bacterium]
FIRSMATRGALGGLAAASHDAIDVLDAAGFDLVLVETVGVGQDEVDAARAVDTVVVVVVPEMGDEVQVAKAGLLEIADVFVVNKADREGADRMLAALRIMLAVAGEAGEDRTPEEPGAELAWQAPVVATVATRGEGVGEVAAAIADHRRYLERSGALGRRRRERLALRVEGALKARLLERVGGRAGLGAAVANAAARECSDPYRLADRLLRELGGGPGRREGPAP